MTSNNSHATVFDTVEIFYSAYMLVCVGQGLTVMLPCFSWLSFTRVPLARSTDIYLSYFREPLCSWAESHPPSQMNDCLLSHSIINELSNKTNFVILKTDLTNVRCSVNNSLVFLSCSFLYLNIRSLGIIFFSNINSMALPSICWLCKSSRFIVVFWMLLSVTCYIRCSNLSLFWGRMSILRTG